MRWLVAVAIASDGPKSGGDLHYDFESYYDPLINFEDDPQRMGRESSHALFCAHGFSDAESVALVDSGYCVLAENIVVDRFYGGAIRRYDGRTRFPLDRFREQFGAWPRQTPLLRAGSLAELHGLIDGLQSRSHKPLIFRGQTRHHRLPRQVQNPAFLHETTGEISLLPSVWRRVLKTRMSTYHHFRDLSKFQWSALVYAQFDLNEIWAEEARAGLIPTMVNLEDVPHTPDFDLLRRFHTQREAYLNEDTAGSHPMLLTLLQHYGLYSPMLDLTSAPDVALFFATHKYAGPADRARYDFVGTNDRQAIVYVIKQDPTEALQYERGPMLAAFKPQRPERQFCVVMPSNPYSMNLAGEVVVAAIQLDFDLTEPGRYQPKDLFPSPAEDPMLIAFKTGLRGAHRANLTEFL